MQAILVKLFTVTNLSFKLSEDTLESTARRKEIAKKFIFGYCDFLKWNHCIFKTNIADYLLSFDL